MGGVLAVQDVSVAIPLASFYQVIVPWPNVSFCRCRARKAFDIDESTIRFSAVGTQKTQDAGNDVDDTDDPIARMLQEADREEAHGILKDEAGEGEPEDAGQPPDQMGGRDKEVTPQTLTQAPLGPTPHRQADSRDINGDEVPAEPVSMDVTSAQKKARKRLEKKARMSNTDGQTQAMQQGQMSMQGQEASAMSRKEKGQKRQQVEGRFAAASETIGREGEAGGFAVALHPGSLEGLQLHFCLEDTSSKKRRRKKNQRADAEDEQQSQVETTEEDGTQDRKKEALASIKRTKGVKGSPKKRSVQDNEGTPKVKRIKGALPYQPQGFTGRQESAKGAREEAETNGGGKAARPDQVKEESQPKSREGSGPGAKQGPVTLPSADNLQALTILRSEMQLTWEKDRLRKDVKHGGFSKEEKDIIRRFFKSPLLICFLRCIAPSILYGSAASAPRA